MEPQELLKNFYLFEGATLNDVHALAAMAERKVFIAGDVVYSAGDDADALFLVEMGTVEFVLPGKQIPLATVGNGQGFGEFSFFDHGKRTAMAYTREPTYLWRLPFDQLGKLLAEQPTLALTCYRNACGFVVRHLRRLASDLNHRYL